MTPGFSLSLSLSWQTLLSEVFGQNQVWEKLRNTHFLGKGEDRQNGRFSPKVGLLHKQRTLFSVPKAHKILF